MGTLDRSIGIKLRIMMLMQYLLMAIWWVPLAAYLTNLNIEGLEKTIILSSMAIGSMASPIFGSLADKYFSGQKILAFSNIATAILVLISGYITNPQLLVAIILLIMFCYMPTISLTSSIAMSHSAPEDFPRIRMFGTVGWVVSGVFSLVAINLFNVEKFDGSNLPMLCGAAVALLAAFQNFTLPDTPPIKSDEKKSLKSILGFDAISMYQNKNYLIFTIISVLAIIPFALFYSFGSVFLHDNNFQYITVTLNWGQVVEMLFLFSATTIIRKVGVKNAMLIGLTTIAVRYVLFYVGVVENMSSIYIFSIMLHGLVFGLFFVGGQIYTDTQAPANLKAQSQGLLSFMVWGVGLSIGTFISDFIIKQYSHLPNHGWDKIFLIATIMSSVVVVLFVLFFKKEKTSIK